MSDLTQFTSLVAILFTMSKKDNPPVLPEVDDDEPDDW